MKYTFYCGSDPKDNDKFVMNSDQNSLFQCSPWASVKNNWDHVYARAEDENGRTSATALILIRNLKKKKKLFYIPRGPVMDYHNEELVSFFIGELRNYAKKHHCAVLRFDPKIHSRMYPYTKREEDNPYFNQDVIDLLKGLGAKHKGFTTMISEATQPRYNAEMDVTSDYFDRLEHKTQKSIRKAGKSGLEIESGMECLDDFAKVMHFTEVRKGVALRGEDYFRNMMEVYGDKAICMVTRINFPKQLQALSDVIAEKEKQLGEEGISKKAAAALKREVDQAKKEKEKLEADYKREGRDEALTCGILSVYNDHLMELFYMGNNPDYMRFCSSYYLYDLCLAKAAELGITECSFGGIEGTLNDGLTLFKSNFPMNVEEYIGEFNIVIDPVVDQLFENVYPWVLQRAAKIRGRR